MSLGENIKNKRNELKLSQEYIADQLGISRQAVSKWETGQSEPTASNLVELAALFEISLSELVDPEKYAKEQETYQKQNSPKKPNVILQTNLSILAIAFQAGALYSCTQVAYLVVDGQKVPDYRFALFKIVLLFCCSVWMSRNLFYETNVEQRKKNNKIELRYCMVQCVIALCVYHFKMGVMGFALIAAVMFFMFFASILTI